MDEVEITPRAEQRRAARALGYRRASSKKGRRDPHRETGTASQFRDLRDAAAELRRASVKARAGRPTLPPSP